MSRKKRCQGRKYPGPWREESKTLRPGLLVSISGDRLYVRTEYEVRMKRVRNVYGDVEHEKHMTPGPSLEEMLRALHLGERQLNLLALMEGGVKVLESLVERFENWQWKKDQTWKKQAGTRKLQAKRWRAQERKRIRRAKEEERKKQLAERKIKKRAAALKKEADLVFKKQKQAERLIEKKLAAEKKQQEEDAKAAEKLKQELKANYYKPLEKFERSLEI